MNEQITLKTKRLTVRPFAADDAELAAYNSNCPAVAAEMSDMVMKDSEEALNWINWINQKASIKAPWQVMAIELTGKCSCIGLVGVIPQQKIKGEIEILFSVADEYQKNGYATEAARAVIEWFFNTREQAYLCAIVKQANIPSQRVIEKLGFEMIEKREIEYEGKPTLFNYYQLTR